MYWLDILIVATMAVGGLIGYRTGLIRTVLAGVGIVAGIFLAGQLGTRLGNNLDFISNPNLAMVAGFVIVFVITFMVAMILSSILRKLLRLIFLSWVDNVAGTIVGIAGTVVIWTALIVATAAYPFSGIDTSIKNSMLSTVFADNIPIVLAILPEEYEDILSFGAEITEPTVSISNLRVSMDLQGSLHTRLAASVTNNNGFAGTIEQLDYKVYMVAPRGMELIGAGQTASIRIKSNATTTVNLEIDLENQGDFDASTLLAGLFSNDPPEIQIQGTSLISFLGEQVKLVFVRQVEAVQVQPDEWSKSGNSEG